MSEKAYIKINGKTVKGEWIEPEKVPFLANPRVQDTAMFMAGVGLAAYKGVRNLAGVALNPSLAEKVRKALPWAALAGMTFFVSPALGKGKTIARIGGIVLGLKAANEFFAPATQEQEVV